jgi:PadR family transcriptional regulator AphA
MAIEQAILGFLSWRPLSGYDLKKLFAASGTLPWSGNSNQIYRALVELHKEKLVTKEDEVGDSGPARKVYSLTEAGHAALRAWVLSEPELPEFKTPFLAQLAWADQLTSAELDDLLLRYEDELRVKLLMLRERAERVAAGDETPARTPREAYLWQMMDANLSGAYKQELAWVRQLRRELPAKSRKISEHNTSDWGWE